MRSAVLRAGFFKGDRILPARILAVVIISALLAAISTALILLWLQDEGAGRRGGGEESVPVAVAEVERGSIAASRTFSGSIEARSTFTVASKVSGRVDAMLVDVGDAVTRGQVVARLDDEEFREAERSAAADSAVAAATLEERRSGLELRRRSYERTAALRDDGLASTADYEMAQSELLAATAALAVAEANLQRAQAAESTARIRRAYTKVTASWSSDNGAEGETAPTAETLAQTVAETRVVTRRHVEPGDTVSANAPLLSVASSNPVRAAFAVTERDYTSLEVGQQVSLRSDAYPQRSFTAVVERLAPTFDRGSRQARVEVLAENYDGALKPGMFVRLEVVLATADDATIVPAQALTRRGGEPVLFLINDDEEGEEKRVREVVVELGLRQGDRVQVYGEDIRGRVVILGQQLLRDGSAVRIPEARIPEDRAPRPEL